MEKTKRQKGKVVEDTVGKGVEATSIEGSKRYIGQVPNRTRSPLWSGGLAGADF